MSEQTSGDFPHNDSGQRRIIPLTLGDRISRMTQQAAANQTVHRWYTRPVFFVADVNRALHFYVDTLGFEKAWHKDTICQVNHGECEIILCEDSTRRDKARLFIELIKEGVAELRH